MQRRYRSWSEAVYGRHIDEFDSGSDAAPPGGWIGVARALVEYAKSPRDRLADRWAARAVATHAVVGAFRRPPPSGPIEVAERLGLRPLRVPFGPAYLQALRSTRPGEVRHVERREQLVVWPELQVGGIFLEGRACSSPLLGPDDAQSAFWEAVRAAIWGSARERLLAGVGGRDEEVELVRFTDLPPLPDRIGDSLPRELAERLQRYGDGPRSLVVIGPTGVGKTTLVRHLVPHLGGNARLLKVPFSVLASDTSQGFRLLDLVARLRPRVLLIDDLDLADEEAREELLAVFEALRFPDLLVAATMMDGMSGSTDAPGSLHFPGMRPGRIDEVLVLQPPGEVQRRAILEARLGSTAPSFGDLVAATTGLTPAYLVELARRVEAHGWSGRRDELALVRAFAPVLKVPEAEGLKVADSEGQDRESVIDAGSGLGAPVAVPMPVPGEA